MCVDYVIGRCFKEIVVIYDLINCLFKLVEFCRRSLKMYKILKIFTFLVVFITKNIV